MAPTDGPIRVRFPAIASAESSISHQLTVLRSRLTQLAGELQPLEQSRNGSAQSAYVQQKQRWESAADDLAAMLGAITAALRATGADDQATESRITAAFGG